MGDVVRLPVLQSSRDLIRSRRKREVRSRTISNRMVTKRELDLGRTLYPNVEGVERPVTRADCEGGERPCPFVSCRHHLYLDVTDIGSVQVNFPDIEPDALEQMPATCSLDVADEGGASSERVGEVLNCTKARIGQIEARAFDKVRVRAPRQPLGDFLDGDRKPIPLRGARRYDRLGSPVGPADVPDEEEGERAELAVGPVWQLFEGDAAPGADAVPLPETPERLATAQTRAYAAYEARLFDRGFITRKTHPEAEERLRQAEETIAARAAEKEKDDMQTQTGLADRIWPLLSNEPISILRLAETTGATTRQVVSCIGNFVAAGKVTRENGEVTLVPGAERRKQRAPRTATPAPPKPRPVTIGTIVTVRDVAKKPEAPGRFVVRIHGLEVDCADAGAVLELARAARAAT